MSLKVNVKDRIGKPAAEVFAAIVEPEQMSRYFTSRANGALEAGNKVKWEFSDVGAEFVVDVREIEPNRRIAFDWAASGAKARVDIVLDAVDPHTTAVAIHEAGWPMDDEGVQRALGQTRGWTDFLCCLKAYVQHGINLRAGRSREDH